MKTPEGFHYSMPANLTPAQVRDGIRAEVQRRLNSVQKEGFSNKRMEARIAGEADAYARIIWFLDHLTFTYTQEEKL